jgi:predicted peroxiredoxin
MASILVHPTWGPEDPTRATLAFLVAKTALAEGHEVTVFMAGEGVQPLRPSTIDAGVSIGSLREHAEAVLAGDGKLCASRLSSEARAH